MMKFYFLLLFTILTSCDSTKKQTFVHRPHINLNLMQDPSTLDPRKGGDLVSSTVHFLLFEGLTRQTPEGEYAPALAEEIELSDDKKTYTFHLKTTYWSDGSLMSSYDILDTWLDMIDPEFPCPNAHLLYPIKNAEAAKKGLLPLDSVGIYAPDPKTLIVELEDPTPYFLEVVSFCVLSPVKQSLAKKNPGWAEAVGDEFICNGPFRPTRWVRGREMLLEKNPHYWDKENVKLPGISFSFINDEITALGMYEMNELDVIGLPFTSIPTDALPQFIDKDQIHTLSCPASTLISFNTEKFPFNNLNLRRAFALAINRQDIIDNITLLKDDNGINLMPPALRKGYSQHMINDHDISRAKFFLKKGLEELQIDIDELSLHLSMIYSNSTQHIRVAQTLQSQWKKNLGVSVELVKLDHKILLSKLTSRDYAIGQCVWYAQYQDPMNLLERFKSSDNPKNYPGFSHPEYTRLLDLAKKELDDYQRTEYLDQALGILVSQIPVTTLYHWNASYMKKPYVKNLVVRPTGSFFLNQVQIDQSIREPSESEKNHLLAFSES
ncbi:MAG: peptide ABC transporter substrate-binding protein [Chlamydiae bacterium]|nr:peptide ABC transporter substrate-binding protein [Chlamydiota bacterium]